MANRVDYENLKVAKKNVETRFNDMLENMEAVKNEMLDLTDNSWKGKSATYFLNVFEEMKAKITAERDQFCEEMQRKLDFWYAEFSDAEKVMIDRASKIE